MKEITFLILLLLHCSISSSQSEGEQAKAQECKTNRSYYQLKGATKGEVLYHERASVSCGIFSTASVTLIRTDKGDIIRVLELCNTTKFFQKSTKVSVVPEGDKTWRVDLVPYDPQACAIKKACFGKISNY